MDNPLMTPNKIKRLIHLAEDKSFNAHKHLNNDDNYSKRHVPQLTMNKSAYQLENSSGILDLERVDAFGESVAEEISLSKSTAFNPGEMTGRSTGTSDINSNTMPLGRHSIAIDSITNEMDKQTCEVHEVMRHSIATDYSFHSKRDLTADEASLVKREGLPTHSVTQAQFRDTPSANNSCLSIGSYFIHKCPEFGNMLAKIDSPDRSMMPSITEVSGNTPSKLVPTNLNQVYELDNTLDSVPVRQVREDTFKVPVKQITRHHINNPSTTKADKQTFDAVPHGGRSTEQNKDDHTPKPSTSKVLNQPIGKATLNQTASPFHGYKNFLSSTAKATDLLLKNLQGSLKFASHDTEVTDENTLNSFSISKIADYLGKQSNVSVTELLLNNQKQQPNKKQPLTEKHFNIQEESIITEDQMTTSTRKTETVSTAGSVHSVISGDNQDKELPDVVVTPHTLNTDELMEGMRQIIEMEHVNVKCSLRSKCSSTKCSSTKSPSTMSTVQDNLTSFKSGDSVLHSSKGDVNTSHVRSPNTIYKELDKSVDWCEVLEQRRLKQEGLAKEQWAEIMTTKATGFVGVSCALTITVTTLTDSWLTAKLQFDNLPNDGKDLTIDMPRLPLLLSPGKSEKLTLYVTSNVELNTTLPFTMFLKDASIDCDLEQKGHVDVEINMPVIQAMSCDGVNRITFPPIQEKSTLLKSFVLLSDCPVDLQLELSISDGDSMFSIKNVQEIKKGDVNKVLIDRQGSSDDTHSGRMRSKTLNKQLCRLTSGNAISVTIKFNAPKLSDLQIAESVVTFNGALTVNLIGVSTVLRKVDLIAVVGSVHLVVDPPADKLYLSNEATSVAFSNTGSIPGVWTVKLRNKDTSESHPFKVSSNRFDLRPGCTKTLDLHYTGPMDSVSEAILVLEDIASGAKTIIEVSGGTDRPKRFPIRTNFNIMSWVRSGRKELSLKNSTDKKLYIRCQIQGEGFAIDLPGGESRGVYSLPFAPSECRPLPIIFSPTTNTPQAATLHLVFDKSSDFSRKVKLYGCGGGESLRWWGQVTCGDTALVRAAARAPVTLQLYNKSAMPAFVCARVTFNLQYMCASEGAQLAGARSVVGARARHAVALRVPWARVERRARAHGSRAASLATLTLLTGHELTRRRILKVIRDESKGELDTSLLPEHLKVLAEPLEGEDLSMDEYLVNFNETKGSLNELIGGLQELTAQVDLPQDFADENTIIISDDSVIEHHTLYE